MRGERWIPCSLLLLTFLPFLFAVEDLLIEDSQNHTGVENRVKRNSGEHAKSTYSGSYYPSNTYSSFPGSYSGYPVSPYVQPGGVAVPYPVPVPYYTPPSNDYHEYKHDHEYDHGHDHCDCKPPHIPPCTAKNKKKPPAEGGDWCECNQNFHPQGCTPKLCEAGILPKLLPLYVCLCVGVNPHEEPPNCIKVIRQGPAGLTDASSGAGAGGVAGHTSGGNTAGHANVLGLADVDGIKTDAKDQLGAGLAGTKLLSDEDNSQLYVDLLSDALGGKANDLPLKSSSSDLLSLLDGVKKSQSLLSLIKRKKREAGTKQFLDLNKGLDVNIDPKKSEVTKLAPVKKLKLVKRGGGIAGGVGKP